MSINTNFATNMVSKENNMINYFFYFNYLYRDLLKREYLGKSFFKGINDYITKQGMNIKRIHHSLYFLGCSLVEGNIEEKIKKCHHDEHVNSNEYINIFKNFQAFGLDYFYDNLLTNFYAANIKHKLFSVFKSNNEKDKDYYLLIGNVKLEKFLENDAIISNFMTCFDNYNELKNMPIGNYFVLIKFNAVKKYQRNIENISQTNNKPFPTNLIKVKYISTEKDLDEKFKLVDTLDFNVF